MNRTCLKCGWVAFGVTREFAETEVKEFNKYYWPLPDHEKELFGGPSSLKKYDRCGLCGGSYENFRDSREGDCPDGCTLGPIIVEETKEVKK